MGMLYFDLWHDHSSMMMGLIYLANLVVNLHQLIIGLEYGYSLIALALKSMIT